MSEVTTPRQIEEKLAVLEPESLEIFDESGKHVGHEGARGGGGHYMLTIVSHQFSGKPVQARHRMVYQALGTLTTKEIHAVSIKAYAPDEM
jgi:BolA protein